MKWNFKKNKYIFNLYQEECLPKTKIKIKDVLTQSNPDRVHYEKDTLKEMSEAIFQEELKNKFS